MQTEKVETLSQILPLSNAQPVLTSLSFSTSRKLLTRKHVILLKSRAAVFISMGFAIFRIP